MLFLLTVILLMQRHLSLKGVIKHNYIPVKVLGTGELSKKLTVKVDKVSAAAKAKIEAAGGKVEEE